MWTRIKSSLLFPFRFSDLFDTRGRMGFGVDAGSCSAVGVSWVIENYRASVAGVEKPSCNFLLAR